MTTMEHPPCNLMGTGGLNGAIPFGLIDISSEKIHIAANARLRLGSRVKIDLGLDGVLFGIRIKCSGVISGKKTEITKYVFPVSPAKTGRRSSLWCEATAIIKAVHECIKGFW